MKINKTQKLLNNLTNKVSSQKTFFREKQQADIVCIQKKSKKKSTENLIKKCLGENLHIGRDWQDLGNFYSSYQFFVNPAMHLIASTQKGLKGIKTHDISCYYNKNLELEKFYAFDIKNKDISVFNQQGERIQYFSPSETNALLSYKSNSKYIHKILREHKTVKNEALVQKQIDSLSKIFKNKAETLKSDIITYRALDKQTLKQIQNLHESENSIISQSFLSVSTKLLNIFPFLNFRNFNHILKLTIHNGVKYLSLDEIGHIITPQFSENELLINKGTKIYINNKSGKFGLIEAEIFA